MSFDFRAEPKRRELERALSNILDAQLIRRAGGADDTDYIFKHALVQDTAYRSLMRQDRRRLHLLVGQALERSAGEMLPELAPILAQHFAEAGETARALNYFKQAADAASARYYNVEALSFYSQALDAANDLDSPQRGALYRARAVIFERIGNFEATRADLETALQLARAHQATREMWESLIALGAAWASRDYARTGEYYERALDLARQIDDPRLVAHTLNRVGNWHLNVEEVDRAFALHQEARSIFESLRDLRGIAESEDFLGMASSLRGNLLQTRIHYRNAIPAFEQLGDPLAATDAYITLALVAPNLQYDVFASGDDDVHILADAERARERAHEFGSLSAECESDWMLASRYGAQGKLRRALILANHALLLATEMQHDQWSAASLLALGAIYYEVLALDRAAELFGQALDLSRKIGSQHWLRTSSGFLASTLIAQNNLTGAQAVLEAAQLPPAPQTLGQRRCFQARAELALAQGDLAAALFETNRLIQDAQEMNQTPVVPQLALLRGRIYLAQGALEAAAAELTAGYETSEHYRLATLLWQFDVESARVARLQNNIAAAQSYAQRGQEIIAALAVEIDDSQVRDLFLELAQERLDHAAEQ